jgi:Type I phosphodiesterase / nucleotide pyrophosphatase
MDICRRQFGLLTLAGLSSRTGFSLTARPKLLVLVVLGQFRSNALAGVWPQLAPGGLRKLWEKGTVFHDCRHAASTFPATTTATLACGAWPAQHGIVADSWYDRTAQGPVTASEEELLATTLASQIAVERHTRVYVVGMESAQAGIFAGTSAAQIYWMDENGDFVTRGEGSDWLDNFNERKLAAKNLHGEKWQVIGGRGAPDTIPPLRVLNFDPTRPRDFMALYKSSPFAQTALFDFLGELMTNEHLGQTGSFDFVCLLNGASTRLGYEIGGRDTLMDQMTLNLDKSIEGLLAQCSKGAPAGPGDGNFNLVLAGAHGAPPLPSKESRERMSVKGEAVAQAIDRGLRSGGLGHVEKYVYPFLYLDTSGFRDAEEARRGAARAAMAIPAVAGFYTAGGACSVRDEWERRFQNSFHPKRSGDLMLAYREGYVEDFGKGRGVSYGSLYNYDVSVPLCFYGPQFRTGTYEAPVESVDVAPTLARASGVEAPSSSTGRVLTEALAE